MTEQNNAENLCPYHIAHDEQIKRNAKDIQKLFSLDGKTTEKIEQVDDKIDHKVDSIKNMIIGGMGVSIVQLAIFIAGIVMLFIKIK